MTIAQKIAELGAALGVELQPDGQIADNLNAITIARGGEISNNGNITSAIKALAATVGDGSSGSNGLVSLFDMPEGLHFGTLYDDNEGNKNVSFVAICRKPIDLSINDIALNLASLIIGDCEKDPLLLSSQEYYYAHAPETVHNPFIAEPFYLAEDFIILCCYVEFNSEHPSPNIGDIVHLAFSVRTYGGSDFGNAIYIDGVFNPLKIEEMKPIQEIEPDTGTEPDTGNAGK